MLVTGLRSPDFRPCSREPPFRSIVLEVSAVDAAAWVVVFMIFVMILIALFWCPPTRARCRSGLCFDHAQTTPGAGRARGTAALTRPRLCCEHWGRPRPPAKSLQSRDRTAYAGIRARGPLLS